MVGFRLLLVILIRSTLSHGRRLSPIRLDCCFLALQCHRCVRLMVSSTVALTSAHIAIVSFTFMTSLRVTCKCVLQSTTHTYTHACLPWGRHKRRETKRWRKSPRTQILPTPTFSMSRSTGPNKIYTNDWLDPQVRIPETDEAPYLPTQEKEAGHGAEGNRTCHAH